MESAYDKMKRLAFEIRQKKQNDIRLKANYTHRRTYIIGQMTLELLPYSIRFTNDTNGRKVIHLANFEAYVRALSAKASIHEFLTSSAPLPKKVVVEVKKDLRYLETHHREIKKTAAIGPRVISDKDQVSQYTDTRHLEKRRKYLVGMIMLHYFPELPPLDDCTNEVYRSQLGRYEQLLNLIRKINMQEFARHLHIESMRKKE